jgi:phosphatidylserine decarboxylase
MPRIAREGLMLTAIPGSLTVFLLLTGNVWAVSAGAVATLAVALFFRDPERKTAPADGEIICAADGRVVAVKEDPLRQTAQWGFRVSVFMSVFNVHINRIPLDGKVLDVRHIPGGFAMAHLEEAWLNNERTEVLIEDKAGRKFLMVQVAGLVARRIICRLSEGDEIRAGQRFGLICFGSRVDLYLPPGVTPCVSVGDRVRAGISVLARV